MEAIVALLGTVVGFILSEVSQWFRSKKEKLQMSRSVRILISLEIDTNLQEVTDFWKEVNEIVEVDKRDDAWKIDIARRIIQIPFPNVSKDALQSQMMRLPEALDEKLLSRVLEFYNHLTQLQIYRSALKIAAYEDKESWGSAQQISNSVSNYLIISSHEFEKNASANYDEIRGIIEKLIADGNPISI